MIQRFDVGARLSEMAIHNGTVYLAGQVPEDASLDIQGQTAQVLAAVDEPLLYARIDTVPDPDGRWRLMEAELIEPDFYLGHDPRSGAGFARAVRQRLEQA